MPTSWTVLLSLANPWATYSLTSPFQLTIPIAAAYRAVSELPFGPDSARGRQ